MEGAHRRVRHAATIVVAFALLSGCADFKQTMREVGDNFRSIGSGGQTEKAGKAEEPADGAGSTGAATTSHSGGAPETRREDAARARMLRITGASIQPDRVQAGSEIKVIVSYLAQAPSVSEQITISEARTLLIDGETIKLGESRIALKAQGRQTATIRITLPAHIPEGTYTLAVALSDGHLKRTVRRSFRVVP